MNPFEDIRATIASIPDRNSELFDQVRTEFEAFDGPQPVIGRWDFPVAWLAEWQQTREPSIQKPLIAVFAGSHGVAGNFVDQDEIIDRSRSRIQSLTEGGAAIRGMAHSMNAAFKVYEMGAEYPVPDITKAQALSDRDCAAAIAYGMEVVAEGADIIALGNAGLGSATAAASIARALYGGTSEYWAGAHDHAAQRRIAAVEEATTLHRDYLTDPLQALAILGGRDLAGLVGAILAARHQSIPVMLDGFVTCIAAAVLHEIDPNAISHCLAGHVSAEPGHGALLDRLNLRPLHDFNLALGDGTGATFAVNTLRLAAAGYGTLKAGQ